LPAWGRGAYRVRGGADGKRPLGRLDIEGIIILKLVSKKSVGRDVDRIDLAQDRDSWRTLVYTVMNGFHKYWDFFLLR
jgi:hypothetical protein